MNDIFCTTGIRASCGVGTNLYLTKIALDITAKHSQNFIGYLDEESYKKTLWHHRPLKDFWRVGAGTADRLAANGIYTMYDIAHADEELLYHLFGIDAELLIDHAWGIEPVTIADIKAYTSKTNCLCSGQVLMCDYNFEDGKLIVKEMMDLLCLDMVEQNLVTSSVTLQIGYSNALRMEPARGTVRLDTETNADIIIIPAVAGLYERIVNSHFPIRRINITVNNVVSEEYMQYSLFTDTKMLEKNRKMQQAMIDIKNKFGKNAILKGMNLQENATTLERNRQIGGHKSGR
jgi:DNA polymerase V